MENVLIKLRSSTDVGIDTICRDIEGAFQPVVGSADKLFPRVFSEIADRIPSFTPPPSVEFDRLAVIIPVRDHVRTVLGGRGYHSIRNVEDGYHFSDAIDDHASAFDQQPARAQGIRLLGNYVMKLLHEQLHVYDMLLGLPLSAENNVFYCSQFSVFFRYWQNDILARHDVVGLSMAVLIWNKYMKQVLPRAWRAQKRKMLKENAVPLKKGEQSKLDSLLIHDNWQRLEEAVSALGKLCHQATMNESRAQRLVQPFLADTLGPHLWGTLAYFAPEEIAAKVRQSDVEVTAQEDIDSTVLLVLALYFNRLPWDEVQELLGCGTEVRTKIGSILSDIPALCEVAVVPEKFGAAMEEAVMDGLIPTSPALILGNRQSRVRLLPPNRFIAQLHKQYEHYSACGDWGLGA